MIIKETAETSYCPGRERHSLE